MKILQNYEAPPHRLLEIKYKNTKLCPHPLVKLLIANC